MSSSKRAILGGDIVLRSDGRKHAALQPSRGPALFVRRRLHVHGRHGMIKVEANVVFAAPNHLHRLAQLLGENGRFRDVIRFRFASETAAQQRHVASDVRRLDAQGLRDGILHGLRILRRRPRLHFAVLEFRDGNRRLHGSVRQMRHIIFGLVHLRRILERGIHVAIVARHLAGLARGLPQRFLVRHRIEGWRSVPGPNRS